MIFGNRFFSYPLTLIPTWVNNQCHYTLLANCVEPSLLCVRFVVFKRFFKQQRAIPNFKHIENMLVYLNIFSMCSNFGMADVVLKNGTV